MKAPKQTLSVPPLESGQCQVNGALQRQVDESPRQQAQQAHIAQLQGVPQAEEENRTGMPGQLKQGIEALSGMDMSDVRVHRNSDQPAQLNALAYAQGNDIHLGPGQEKHLPHEVWHVVQQRQGRVKPTLQMQAGVPVNDEEALEREADVMGERANLVNMTHQRKVRSERETVSASPTTLPTQALGKAVLQGKELQLETHGKIWVPEDMSLVPDKPIYGATVAVGTGLLAHDAATSMEVLVTPAHPKGSEPGSLDDLFEGLPTKGKYKNIAANAGQTKDGSTLYIKGHLLNDNLGGAGTEENLFPITHQANVDHDQKVEEPIKDHVNKHGGAVHYKVTVDKRGEGVTKLFSDDSRTQNLKYINANFLCEITEYKNDKTSKNHSVTIASVWGGTDNSGVGKVSLLPTGEHGVASTFDASKVQIMPRAKAKAEWDAGLLALAQHFANIDGINLSAWLVKNLKGVGGVGAKLLVSGEEYGALSKASKATLTKARNILEKFLLDNYAIYLTVTAGYDESDATDDPSINVDVVIGQEAILHQAMDEIDLLCLQFSRLRISPEVTNSTGEVEIKKPVSEYGGTRVESMSVTLEEYKDGVQFELNIRTPLKGRVSIFEDYTSQAIKITNGKKPPYSVADFESIKKFLIWALSEN